MKRGIPGYWFILFVLCTLLLNAGCGGGGASSNSGTPGGKSTGGSSATPGQAQGVYSGTASSGSNFETIILPNDTYYALYGTNSGNTFYIEGMITGQGTSSNGSYTATVIDYYYTGTTYKGSVTASYVAGLSINGTLTETGNPVVTFNGTALPSSSFNYNTPAALSDTSGAWTGMLMNGSTAIVTINPNGTFSGSDSGCLFSGTINPDASGKNFFDISLTYGATPCLLPNQTQSGIVIDYLLLDGVTRQLMAGVSAGTNYGTVFVSTSKPVSIASVSISPMMATLTVGATQQLTAAAMDASGSPVQAQFTWHTSFGGVVSIDNNGLATAVAPGTVQITANAGGITSPVATLTVTQTTQANNVAAITVDRGPTGSYTNGLWATVTVCVQGTTTCQSIDHVLVDTGSMGLRVLGSVLTLNLPAETDASGNTIAECGQFLDGFTWGPLHTADIKIAGEAAGSVPIQVIGEASFAVPPGCTSTGVNEDTLATLQANGILGIGLFLQDCGSFCVTSIPSTALYYSCSSTPCNPSTATLAQQLQNPVSKFTTDNNGTIIELPGISNSGAPTVSGSLVFGIGTQSNNGLQGAIPLATDAQGNISTVFNGTQYSGTFIDSGSNGLFILDAGTLGITNCASPDTSFYCPGAPNTTALNLRNVTATNLDSHGDQSAVSFGIANAEYLFTTNGGANWALNDLGGPNASTFDWGLPFFFGRNVYTAIENRSTPAGVGPYFAY